LVAIDKFSKWIEVRPLNSIRSEQAVVFFTNIIHRFGVPNSIITDNGTQFTSRKFLDFCEDHHIRVVMRHDARSSRRRINLQITSFKEAKITCCKQR
jgi:transposase InsO family protein